MLEKLKNFKFSKAKDNNPPSKEQAGDKAGKENKIKKISFKIFFSLKLAS